jgi:UDP-N-acetylglucosamine diphosphorylase / glucose-1-phosphate thymidylyltransferase / UDP-N-acetylgalactosamine diphosphorylase / glucosamine-1-phosphate N-acetyltransferase / galactosamine-1-phosphate N-acetyltransferase
LVRKAVVLAAGRGTRMKQLTDDRPKPMLLIGGKPMLEHVLDRLRAAGFTEALIVTGYRGEMIEAHFRGHPMQLVYRVQETLDGTGGAARLARDFAGGDNFLLTFGDILVNAEDYAGIAARLESDAQTEAVVGVKWVDDPWQGAAVYEQDGILTRMVEKPPQGTSRTHWNSAGLYAFRASVFDELVSIPKSPRGEYELPTAVEQLLARGARVRIHAIEGVWRDVGRPEDLPEAEKLLS